MLPFRNGVAWSRSWGTKGANPVAAEALSGFVNPMARALGSTPGLFSRAALLGGHRPEAVPDRPGYSGRGLISITVLDGHVSQEWQTSHPPR
ncbi:hypothetical protein JCM15519_05990 [Fundidesulfovibrio butyratiphilus]